MEPKELSPEVAGKILDADFQNVVKKVAAGKPLTVAERTRIEARAAGSEETLAYAKTLVELAAVLGVTRRTLTTWQKMDGSPKPLSNGLWPVADWREFVRMRGLKAGKTPVGNEEALKARKLLAEVEERELRIAVKKGEYVPLTKVRERMDRAGGPGDLRAACEIRERVAARSIRFGRHRHPGGMPQGD